jgi:hypothetical protein
MVVKLNMILITSPELAEFRKRLKNIESKVSHFMYDTVELYLIFDGILGRSNALHLDLQIVVS